MAPDPGRQRRAVPVSSAVAGNGACRAVTRRVTGVMAHSPAGSRSQVLEKAAALADRTHHGTTEVFLNRYYRHVADDDLLRQRPEDLLGAAASHRELAHNRPVGSVNVRAFTPTVEEHGWSTGHTVIEIVTDDMPFLVDSVQAELNRAGRAIHLVVHPVLIVRRDATGVLLEQVEGVPTGADPPYDTGRESWMHLEIDREADPAELEALTGRVRAVLDDVRDAVEDWPKMRQAATRLADELADQPPPGVDEDEVKEARRLLSWLSD